MFMLKMYILVYVFIRSCVSSQQILAQNDTAKFLWKLSNIALQSRKTHNHYPYPYSYKYPGKYPEYYQNYPVNSYTQYPGSTYHTSQNTIPYPYELPVSHKPTSTYGQSAPNDLGTYSDILQHFAKPKQSLMEVLHSVASNDNLQCVPKLICEVTSGTIAGRQQGLNLPLNVNMESLLSFLSSLNGAQSSPLLYFGKAALLGFSSKGNTGTCNYAYPECPSDPDKVVKYLNNHNGGFFRFFNGAEPSQNIPQNYQQIPHWKNRQAEQRIQNNAVDYVPNTFRHQSGIAFPREEYTGSNLEHAHSFRAGKAVKFPISDFISNNELNQNIDNFYSPHNGLKFPSDNYEHPVRNPKELQYDYLSSDDNLDLQRPLPNHKATPMIFPVRTGTGDLRLDPEELQDYKRPIYYQDDDVRIFFNGGNTDDFKYVKNGRDFNFPV